MAEETGTQTTAETNPVVEPTTEPTVTEPVTTPTTEPATKSATEPASTDTEPAATNPFSKDDLDWTGFESLTDEAKDALVKNYSGWFKGKDEANAFLKASAEANKTNKENQTKKIQELEAGWEKSLKTDTEFGKDYEGNKKKVADYVSSHLSEQDMADYKKYGFDKSPALNRMILGFVKQIEDAKIVGKAAPAPSNTGGLPRDRFGRTMFDFTKKQS